MSPEPGPGPVGGEPAARQEPAPGPVDGKPAVRLEPAPDVLPPPPRSRGVIALLEENCTVCMLCARECPDWCIHIESHQEVVPAPQPGGRPRTRNVLDRFAIDFGLCMYCGICIEVCPFDALFWVSQYSYAAASGDGLVHERDQLRAWMWDVPVPPPLDAAAEPAAEVVAADRAERLGNAGVGADNLPGKAVAG